jgi:hypothetical protein
MILIRCEACGDVHAINFCNKQEFDRARCRAENAPIFCTRKKYTKVYREFQEDLMKKAVNI